ncbi:MAG: AsmA-like C-terminal region-containing protein [Pseudomonadota bacterium]
MIRAALIASGLLAAGLVLAVVALSYGITLTAATPYLEKKLGASLGRRLEFLEAPRLKIGLTTRLDVTQLRIHDAPWTENPHFLTLGTARIELKTTSLLNGPLIVQRLEVHDAALYLVTNEDGESNLPVGNGSSTSEQAEPRERSVPIVILERALISNVSITRENKQSGKRAQFRVDGLSQSIETTGEMAISGNGKLQKRPWTLSLTGTPLVRWLDGETLLATYEGAIDGLQLRGRYLIPAVEPLANLELDLNATGALPAEIADLSPLLTPGSPMAMNLSVSDSDPGISFTGRAELEELSLNFSGSAARPTEGDGLDLDLTFGARSLAKLAAALGVGDGPDTPVEIAARVKRDGAAISMEDVNISAGQHQIGGRANFPAFPSTDDATLELLATGPDFGLYQRLLGRPIELVAPYRIHAALENTGKNSELVDADFEIGGANGHLKGELGSFPSYRDSELTASFGGPDLQVFGRYFAIELPAVAFSAGSMVSVSDSGVITIRDTNLEAGEVSATVSGSLGTYPALNELDVSIELHTDSLAVTSAHFSEKRLQDLPLDASAHLSGDARDVAIDKLDVRGDGIRVRGEAGRLTFQSSDSNEGATASDAGSLRGNLVLAVNIDRFNNFLADLGNAALPNSPLSFRLRSTLDEDSISARLEDLESPGLRGSIDLNLNRDLSLDQNSRFNADVTVLDLRALLPELATYQPPAQPLRIVARSSDSLARVFELELQSGDSTLLSTRAQPGVDGKEILAEITGQAPSLAVFGTVNGLPSRTEPFALDSSLELSAKGVSAKINELAVGQGRIRGSLAYLSRDPMLTGQFEIRDADLTPWMENRTSQGQGAVQKPEDDGRLIPAIPLPRAVLRNMNTDLTLEVTGLIVPDPVFPQLSFIDTATLALRSGEGKAELTAKNVRGSRGTLNAIATLAGNEEATNVSLSADVEAAPFGMLSRASSYKELPKQDFSINLSGTGSDTRELAATLTGEVLLAGGPGTLKRTALNFATESFAAQLIKVVLPSLEKQAPTMDVECTVVAARADQGIVTLDPGFVFRSERLDLSARGTIDLAQERLAIRFDNQARKGLGISAASLVNPYVQITGTMSKPTIGLDLTSTAIMGGAAIASGGLTVLAKPLFGRFIRNQNPCATALQRWEGR